MPERLTNKYIFLPSPFYCNVEMLGSGRLLKIFLSKSLKGCVVDESEATIYQSDEVSAVCMFVRIQSTV
jgi:hypothetical protein